MTDRFLLTVEEAAQILGLGRSKVYELLSTGQLGSVKIGRARRISIAALETFVNELAKSDDEARRG